MRERNEACVESRGALGRRSSRSRVLWAGACLLGGSVFASSGLGAETNPLGTIRLASGRTLEGVEIVQARWDGVQYRQKGGPPVMQPGAQVLSIERKSDLMSAIRRLVESGDFSRAEETIKTVPANQSWAAAEGMVLLAEAYQSAGKSKEAIQVYRDYLAKYKPEKDWFVPQATLGLADAFLAANQPGTAAVHYKELQEYGPRWELYAKLGQGAALLKEKGASSALEARRLFDEVLRNRAATLELRQKALVGRARAYLLQGQNDQVVKELSEGMFDSPKPEELAYSAERAEASLLMGRAYMAMGGKENLEQAEIWLLRVPALYGRHAGAYAQACDALVEVYAKLKNEARVAEWKRRKSAGSPGGGT
ncbi:MAG: tetratricopeptide repeat protein [Planctomycetota bacterium]